MNKKVFLPIAFFLIIMVVFSSFQTQQDHKVLFEKAKYTMETKADLKEAINIFESLIKTYPNEKEYVAKSLLYQGLCYERLGNQEAVKKYRQIVDNYPGQKDEVALAQERLSKLLVAEKVLNTPTEPKFTKINIPTNLPQFVALSPDGKNLALVSANKLWKMPLSGNLGSDIPGIPEQINTEGVLLNDWSPLSWSLNGKWIAFNNGQSIYVVSSDGGKQKKVIDINRGMEAINYHISLSANGNDLAFSSVEENKQHIFSTPVDKVIPRQLVEMEARNPVFSPDGKYIAFVKGKNEGIGEGNPGLWVVEANGSKPYKLADADDASCPIWSPDGKLIAFLDYSLLTQISIVPFSKTANTNGKVIRIDAPVGVALTGLAGWTHENKIGVSTVRTIQSGLYTMPVEGGQAVEIFHRTWAATQPRWSKNGEQIYFVSSKILESVSASGGESKLYRTNKGETINQLGFLSGNRVSPDGKWIVTSTWAKADTNNINVQWPTSKIWKLSVDGEDAIQVTNTPGNFWDSNPCWSADGEKIAFVHTELIKKDMFGDSRIYIIDSNGGEPELLDPDPCNWTTQLIWSPDGKKIAYTDGDLNRGDTVILKIIDIKSRDIRVIEEPLDFSMNSELVWSPDSKRIAFNDAAGKVIKIMNIDDGSIEVVESRLVDARMVHLDWSPDGKRFVFGARNSKVREFWLMEDFLPLEEMAEQHFKKGNELFGLWEYDQAIEEYKKALVPDPNSLLALNAQYCIGHTLFRQGKYNMALETFKKLVKENPESNIAPVTELMISQVEYEMKENALSKNVLVSEDKDFITDEESGISYHKVKTFAGKNDIISHTGGLNLSPDARFVVLENKVVPLEGGDPFNLVNKEYVYRAVYSPRMNKAAFFADSAIWVIPVSPLTGKATGDPVRLLNGDYDFQNIVSWSPDETKIAFVRQDSIVSNDVWTLSVTDGTLKPITFEAGYENRPVWSPDGKSIVYDGDGYYLAPVFGGDHKKITQGGGYPHWSTDGKHIIFADYWGGQRLFSLDSGKEIKYTVPEEIGRFLGFNTDENKLFFYRSSFKDRWGLKVVSVMGGPSFKPALDEPVYDSYWSKDGNFILIQSENNKGEIVFKISSFTGGKGFEVIMDIPQKGRIDPFAISSDQSQLAYSVEKEDGKMDLYVVPFSLGEAKTSGPERLIFKDWTGGAYNVTFNWSEDGSKIALIHNDDIWVVPLNGEPRQITFTDEKERWVCWSPDGKWISYILPSYQTATLKIISADGSNTKIIDDKNKTSRWSPDSKSLVLLSEDQLKMVSVNGELIQDITDLKELRLTNNTSAPQYSPDGKYLAFIGYNKDEESLIYLYSFEKNDFTKLAFDVLDDYKYALRWSPDGKWLSYLTYEQEKVRPEGVLWEADFEEVKEKLLQ